MTSDRFMTSAAQEATPLAKGRRSPVASVHHTPLPPGTAWRAVAHCAATSAVMLVRGDVRLPRSHVGSLLRFADGTRARVYRETEVPGRTATAPCLLVVRFRLRHVRGRGHALFRMESILNTPLFVGFPGFLSKLWLAHDEQGNYRGLYEWDRVELAEGYARSLWRVLALVSEPGSVDYQIIPGVRRDAVLEDPGVLTGRAAADSMAWWRVVAVR